MKRAGVCLALVLLALGATGASAQTAYIIDSDGTNHLWLLNTTTGVATDIGALNYDQIEGLALSPGGVLYGVDDETDTLVIINTTTAVATAVGSGNGNLAFGDDYDDLGLAFDANGNLWLTAEYGDAFFSVNPTTGQATLITESQDPNITGLAACGTIIYGLADGDTPQLAVIDPNTGAVVIVGNLSTVLVPDDGGLTIGSDGVLLGVADDDGGGSSPLFSINRATGNATFIANVTDGANPITGIESIAATTPPPAVCDAIAVPALGPAALGSLGLLLAIAGIWVLLQRRRLLRV